MGKKDKDKKRDKKHKKDKKKRDKKRKIDYSSSDSDSEREARVKRSKYEDEDPSRKEHKEKKKRKKSKKDYNSSSSSSSSSDSESDKERKHKKSKSKPKEIEPTYNTVLLGTKIASKDYETVRMKFKAWLEEEKIGTLAEIEAKNDLLMSQFGKFTKLWNEGTLTPIYYHKEEGEVTYVRPTFVAPTAKPRGPEAPEPAADDNKYNLVGDGGLSDRYLTGGREVPWIHKSNKYIRMTQERNQFEKRQTKLTAKAEAYQEKEREKMEDFKKVMGLA